jgi:hypothetical protein
LPEVYGRTGVSQYDQGLDLAIGLSSLFAAFTLTWILLFLFGALVLGAVVAGLFGSIFYGMSRLAKAAENEAERDGNAGISSVGL